MFLPLLLAFWLPGGTAAAGAEAASRDAIVRDWLEQDVGDGAAACFKSGDSAAVEAAAVRAVAHELGAAGQDFAAEAAALLSAGVPGSDPRWRALYTNAGETRRGRRLAPLLAQYRRIVFAKHFHMRGSHYAYTEALSDAQQ